MRLWNKLRARFGRGIEDELAEEMRLHRAELEQRFLAEGATPRQARERAAREFGPALAALEHSRAEWSFAWLDSLWMDIRFGLRALRRSKAFAGTAVFTLAIGLALASVAFTLFNAYVLRPFAVRDPDSLYAVAWRAKDRGHGMHSWRVYESIRARRDVFTDALATRSVFALAKTRHWAGLVVSGNYFRMLGPRLALGRPIDESDARSPLGDNVVVISHAVWKSVFHLDPAVIGTKIPLRAHTYEVIGVAAEEFGGLRESPPDFWAPMSMHAAFRTEDVAVEVVGRLRPGVSKEHAEAALAPLAVQQAPDLHVDLHPRATVVAYTPFMLVAFAPVVFALGLVLATCCANVANMMLARGLARQREIGVRLSVGAGRARLIRQLLTEALVIAMLAGIAGIVLARGILEAGQWIFFATVRPELARAVRLFSLEPDHRVFAFALAVAAVAAIGAALLPAWQSTRMNLVAALRGEFGARIRASRLRDGLVVGQVVVCAVLLVCGVLLYRRAGVFQQLSTGMQHYGVVDMNAGDRKAGMAGVLRTWPDAEAVAVASQVPMYGRLVSARFNSVAAGYNFVSPEYFDVFRIPLKSGRLFSDVEARAEAPVAIVSAATAALLWPGEDPIGKTLRTDLAGHTQFEVIGVAADVMHGWVFDGLDKTCIYLPASIASKRAGNLLVRMRGDEGRAVEKIRRFVTERWPLQDAEAVALSSILALQVYPFRAAGWIGWLLGLVAMGLSVSGMYGVMSYLVSQRSKEIGIRMALGASRRDCVLLVLRRSAWLSGVGAVIGGTLAGGVVQLLLWWSSKLNVLAWDSFALLAGAGLAGAAAVTAALGPSSRAAQVDPNVVLRAD